MKLVLGGSRKLARIPENLVELLKDFNLENNQFLIGDAPGSDTALQQVLVRIGAKSVTVYSSAGYIRNNLGNWPSEHINSGLESKSNAVHAFKDRHMTKVADWGLMLWDCESAGTLSNVIDLVESGKFCKVWVAQDSELYTFENEISLNQWLLQYPEVTKEALKRLKTSRNRTLKRSIVEQPNLFT